MIDEESPKQNAETLQEGDFNFYVISRKLEQSETSSCSGVQLAK